MCQIERTITTVQFNAAKIILPKKKNTPTLNKKVAAFRGMHVSPAKHSSASVTDRQTYRPTDGQTDGRTDGQTTDKVIPMCRYASQATQKHREKNTITTML